LVFIGHAFLKDGSLPEIIHTLGTSLMILAFPILFIIRLEVTHALPMTVVLTPLLLILASLMLYPLTRYLWEGEIHITSTLFLILIPIPFFALFLIVGLRIDGTMGNANWGLINIPILLFFFIGLVLLPLAACLFIGFEDHEWDLVLYSCCAYCWLGIPFVVSPVIAFFALLILKLQGYLDYIAWRVVFVPLFYFAGIICCIDFWFSFIVIID